jgi:hypothetical protein
MDFSAVDVLDELRDGHWRGLLMTAREHVRRPAFHVEAGRGRRFRICSGEQPFLWARVTDDYYGYAYVRARTGWRSVIRPIHAADVREVTRESEKAPPRSRAWAKWFFRAFAGGGDVIASAQTFVGPCEAFLGKSNADSSLPPERLPVPCAPRVEEVPSIADAGYVAWDLTIDLPPLPARGLSAATDGRVKAWRKLVRDGTLPPVLLGWINGLQRYLILDGHDRLLAALLEGVVPECLAVSSVSESHPRLGDTAGIDRQVAHLLEQATPLKNGRVVAQVNRLLLRAHDDRPRFFFATRGWPLAGGTQQWDREVERELEDRGDIDDKRVLLRP